MGGRLDLARALAGVVVALAAMAAPTRVEAQVGRREVVAVYFEGNATRPTPAASPEAITAAQRVSLRFGRLRRYRKISPGARPKAYRDIRPPWAFQHVAATLFPPV